MERAVVCFLPRFLRQAMTQPAPPTAQDVTQWLAEHGDVLFRFALKRLGSREVAEDLVQDTFVAALRSLSDFEGRSAVQTWLIGILRHKIADHLRQKSRRREQVGRPADADASQFQNGHWRVGLTAWPSDPARSLEIQEFWQVLEECQHKLPDKLAAVFRMRELEELPVNEICTSLEISATNLSVRLHRARLLLRDCLDRNWFSARRRVT